MDVELTIDVLTNLLESTAPTDCSRSDECFSRDNRWGWLAYDDPESNMCGGKPWAECFCASKEQEAAIDLLNSLSKQLTRNKT